MASRELPTEEIARAALEQFGGGFAAFRAVFRGDQIIDWRILDANLAMRTRLANGEPVVGRCISELLPLGENTDIGTMYYDALATGERQERVVRVVAESGPTWRHLIVLPLGDDTVVTMTNGIGGLAELHGSAAALADHASDIVAISTLEDGVMWVSPSVERALGHVASTLVGRCVADLVHPDDIDGVVAAFLRVTEGAAVDETVELRLQAADGSHRWFECALTNRSDDPLVRGVILHFHDIAIRRQSEEALRRSEVRVREILETAGDGIITLDETGHIEQFNRPAERIFRVDAASVIGQPYTRLIRGDTSEIVRSESRRTARSREPIEVRSVRADGEPFVARISVSRATVDGRALYTAFVREVVATTDDNRHAPELRDELTGLGNRRWLLARLEERIAEARNAVQTVGVIFLDLDRFKLVNETLGHNIGDELLKLVAQRLRDAVPEADIGRLGGDEFVIVSGALSSVDQVIERASAVEQCLRVPFAIEQHEVTVTASIGVTAWTGEHETPIELMRFADTAMYRAKDRGRDRLEVFDDAMLHVASTRLDIESALRSAVSREELLAYYQPVVRLRDGRAVHMEALVRWNRPGVRLVPPLEFIGIAEETGLINQIGAWMLRRAAADCGEWQDVAPGVGVSVNVSARQFEDGTLLDRVADALVEAHLAPELLRLEITESVLLERSEETIAMLNNLRDRGIRLSLDDFGTGYSSLTYLQRLPIDELKIDRSFVAGLEDPNGDRTLLRTIVQLGRGFGLSVVAEGIDSTRKLNAVQQLGCHYAQGFLFAKPAPLAEIRRRFQESASSLRSR